jgi:Spo0E like sporulation regulatory protein
METRIASLLSSIESTRLEMIRLAHQFGYSNPSVIQCSQKLDSLLNVYHHKLIKS